MRFSLELENRMPDPILTFLLYCSFNGSDTHWVVSLCGGYNSQSPHIMTNRSTTADKYRKHYFTKQWRILRGTILTRDLYCCQRCNVTLTDGRSDPRSAIVHHKQPHKGNLTLFYDPDNLEAVCWSCHSGAIQSEEALGYDKAIGADGWPVDARHPSA